MRGKPQRTTNLAAPWSAEFIASGVSTAGIVTGCWLPNPWKINIGR
jgi:hypothetical protein